MQLQDEEKVIQIRVTVRKKRKELRGKTVLASSSSF